ncbi:MAG: TRL-like family protein [Bacteriovoracaceae bacterium]|nr:TRL-like family protein [Bacteriovoracaceae bacterium]
MKVNCLLLLISALFLTSCASTGPTGGLLFHDIKYGVNSTTHEFVTKKGEACQTSVLGLVGSGDASIDAAKKDGSITKVASIDASSFSVLWFFNKYCTIVRGN